ncbi:hypothetical protein [Streptomyces umbrinus]|uniref:hypothetical protein n=1 Tax=Streptomyces umbrinus TaxID=67370 RepID=UPI0033ECF45D
MTDGSRTLTRKQQTARLATLSLNRVSLKEPAVLRTGRWTEVVYSITNHSRSSYPKAQVQAEYSVCAADSDDQLNTDTCPDGAAQSSATSLRTQWHDGTGWRDVTVPDDGSLLAETLTMPFGTLAADSTRTFRFTGSEELDANVRRLMITARVNGKAASTAERSLAIASPLTFDSHLRHPLTNEN